MAHGCEPALVVKDQFLGGQPSHALHKSALDLADIQRRVERRTHIMKNIDAFDFHLAGQRINHYFAAGMPHRRNKETDCRKCCHGPR